MQESTYLTPDTVDGEIAALQTPTQSVSLGFQVALTIANTATWIALLPVVQVLLPQQAEILFGDANKVGALAIITGIGALPPLVITPLVGALSDRTAGKLGRRRPWLLAGAVLAAGTLFVQSQAATLVALTVCWTVLHIFTSIVFANLTALLPDRVPVRQRATVAAAVSFSLPLAAIVGLLIVQRAANIPLAYILFAGTVLGVVGGFALLLREAPLPPAAIPPFRWRDFLAGFWIRPGKHPDFAWAWLTRFLVYLSYSVATGYLYYYLQDVAHYPNPTKGVIIFQSIIVGTNLVGALASGILSDRLQQRKIFVIVASMLLGLAVALLGFFPTWGMIQLVAALVGLGFGIYLGVDLALITQVLPSSRDRAKDLGIINIANALPQVAGPPLAALAILTFHSYVAMFLVAAVLAAVGGALITRIQGVR